MPLDSSISIKDSDEGDDLATGTQVSGDLGGGVDALSDIGFFTNCLLKAIRDGDAAMWHEAPSQADRFHNISKKPISERGGCLAPTLVGRSILIEQYRSTAPFPKASSPYYIQ